MTETPLAAVARGICEHLVATGRWPHTFDNLPENEKAELMTAVAVGLSRLSDDARAGLIAGKQ